VLVQLLKDTSNSSAYAEWIQSHIRFRRVHEKLITIEQTCSQSAFEESVDEIRKELDEKFDEAA
jgi:hypothetical protein